MKRILLIALLSLAGFTGLSAADETPAANAPEAIQAAAPEILAAPGKPCPKTGMGMPSGKGMEPGMAGKPGMMMGGGRACQKTACGCKMHTDMSQRVDQLEKRLDALQMALEVMARQQGR